MANNSNPTITEAAMAAGDQARKAWEKTKRETKIKQMERNQPK